MNPGIFFFLLTATLSGALLAPLFIYAYVSPSRVKKFVNPLLSDPSFVQSIMPQAEIHVDKFLRERLPAAMPVVGMLIGEKTIAQMKGIFLEELGTLFPIFMGTSFDHLLTGDEMGRQLRRRLAAGAIAPGAAIGVAIGLVQCVFCWLLTRP